MSTNLVYENNSDKVCWRVNLKSIKNNFFEIFGYENNGIYKGDMVVLLGELSNKWELEIFKKNFPNINQDDIKIVENAGKYKF